MKKLLLIPLLSAAIFSCGEIKKSPNDIAKVLIKDFVQETFDDPESYEPLDFSSIDTFNSIDLIGNPEKKLVVVHKFRAKNRMGAKILEQRRFLFNLELDSVIKMTEL